MTARTLEWFHASKGYGFITPDGGGQDVLVDPSTIEDTGNQEHSEAQPDDFESVRPA